MKPGRVIVLLGAILGIAAACSSTRAAAVEAGCESGDANACEVLAAMYLLGEGVPKDEAKASGLHRRVMTLRSRACSEGDKEACSKLGMAIASVPLDAPRGPAADPGAQMVFGVSLFDDGQVLVNDKPVKTDEALLAIAEEHVKANPDSRAVIRASAGVKHGRVIRVLDLLKQAGLTKIAFGVTPAASATP